jgi:hypothetical protein
LIIEFENKAHVCAEPRPKFKIFKSFSAGFVISSKDINGDFVLTSPGSSP